MASPLLELGPSSEPVGQVALGLGLLALAAAVAKPASARAVLLRGSSRTFVLALATFAALLSYGYILYFLRGGPRIVDATSYYLEARGLSAGHFAFPVPEPTGAFRGRFSLLAPGGLAVIFPPGYPLLLALGFRLGVPLLVGPVLAALLVAVTFAMAKQLGFGEEVARLAAVLSTLCAALRYHTADTMSHGLSALLLAGAITAAARPNLPRALLAGACVGWLIATRPFSGAVGCAIAFALLGWRGGARHRAGLGAVAALGMLPGLCLLAWQQRAVTGSLLGSTQLAYYSLADGPLGCFRWGFGSRVGCRFEHGDFVKQQLPHGFGALEALRVTGQRLAWHAFDIANFAPAALLVPWLVWRERSSAGVRWLGVTVVLLVLAYVPFYFPGSYPGGGARLLAEALPAEQVLLALALVRLGAVAFAPALLLLGFALNTVHAHLALREREGGRPMFESRILASQGITHGLVFVHTDHGFALGHDPSSNDPKAQVVVARGHGDAHDLALWTALGRPPAFRYDYDATRGTTRLVPYQPPTGAWHWELEAEWPPRALTGGWAEPEFDPCLSRGRGLGVHPDPAAAVELELGAPAPGAYGISLDWLADPGAAVQVRVGDLARRVTHEGRECERTELGRVRLVRTQKLRVETGARVILDAIELTRDDSK